MMPNTRASDMMVANLTTLSPDMDVLQALDVLLRNGISGAPVVDQDGIFIGTFSEKSCIRFVVNAAYESIPACELMPYGDRDPPAIILETDLLCIAQTFLDAACRRLPVLDRKGRLLGQISRRDVMREVRDYFKRTDRVDSDSGLYLSAVLQRNERPSRVR